MHQHCNSEAVNEKSNVQLCKAEQKTSNRFSGHEHKPMLWKETVLKSYLSPAGFKILAHRGSCEGGAVENTLEAFHFAVDSGVRYLETDIQATKDGVAVLFHDKDLRRIASIPQKVSQLTLHQLRNLKLDGVGQIPTLQEALERFPETRFNLDLKTKDAIVPAIEVINKLKVEDRVLVSSFSRSRRVQALSALGPVATSGDMVTVLLVWLGAKLNLGWLIQKELAKLSALQIPTHVGIIRFDSPAFISMVRKHGVELHYWTINDVEEAKRLRALGADGIVTDQSKMMTEWFRKSK